MMISLGGMWCCPDARAEMPRRELSGHVLSDRAEGTASSWRAREGSHLRGCVEPDPKQHTDRVHLLVQSLVSGL